MKLSLNKEFFIRHLAVTLLMAGMGCWFGYDGYVGYPSQTPRQLYMAAHENAEPESEAAAQKFYDSAIPRQKQFMAIAFLAALAIGGHLFAVSRLKVDFDGEGFTWKGHRFAWADVKKVDDSQWEKKGISRVILEPGTLVLDSWHHKGVKELHELLAKPATEEAAS